jgi:hypothetical protein
MIDRLFAPTLAAGWAEVPTLSALRPFQNIQATLAVFRLLPFLPRLITVVQR